MSAAEAVVFIVDDDVAMRDALELFFKAVGRKTVSYSGAEEFLVNYDPSQPGCLVLDIRMPGMSGTELQEKLAARRIDIPIIFLTGHGDLPTAVRGMRGGAVTFLAKPFEKHELLAGVREALGRDANLRREKSRIEEAKARLASLSSRERQVLDMVLAGRLNKQIAVELDIAERTVEDHRRHIMEKVNADSVPALVRLVMISRADDADASR